MMMTVESGWGLSLRLHLPRTGCATVMSYVARIMAGELSGPIIVCRALGENASANTWRQPEKHRSLTKEQNENIMIELSQLAHKKEPLACR
jgi:hypothetical protein